MSKVIQQRFVSIICFAYNHEKYIRETLNGFVMQKTNFSFEIVIHDDASTDKTADIIREYEKKHPTIFKPIYQVVNQYTLEKGRVTKICYAAAKGKYIALCEGDDYWTDPLKLQKQVDFLENNKDYNLCAHDTDIIKEGVILKKEWRWDPKRTTFTVEDYIYALFFHTSSALFRNFENRVMIKDSQILQGDIILFLSVINDKKVHFIEEVMSVYRLHEGGITNSALHKSKLNTYKSLLIILEKFDLFSNYKFRNLICLKKQTIKSLIFLFDQTKENKIKPFVRLKYYLFKIVLLISVKIIARINGFKHY